MHEYLWTHFFSLNADHCYIIFTLMFVIAFQPIKAGAFKKGPPPIQKVKKCLSPSYRESTCLTLQSY